MFTRLDSEVVDATSGRSRLLDDNSQELDVTDVNGNVHTVAIKVRLSIDFSECDGPHEIENALQGGWASGDYRINAVIAERPM